MDIKALVNKHLLSKNYYLYKISSHFWHYLNSRGKQPLVIYQMGKVGSWTILDSLEASNIDMSLFHVHVLSHENIRNVEKEYYGENRKIFREAFYPETKHLFASHYLRTQLDRNLKKKKWKFITLVRDPIARNISYFFYSTNLHKLNQPLAADFHEQHRSNAVNMDKLTEQFLEEFQEDSVEYNIPLNWFDFELSKVLGLDIYSTEFPKSKGYKLYEGEFADVLLLKLESLRESASAAFNEFLGLKDFSLITANTAKQQRYYPAYKEFLSVINLPSSYIDRIYNSKYVQHFYTDEEINSFWKKWHKQPRNRVSNREGG